MSDEKIDYEKVVKNCLRLRLMDCGWTYNLSFYIKNRIMNKLEVDEKTPTIKFEQLYNEVITRARLAVPVNMEEEFHHNIDEYLSVYLDENSMLSVPSRVDTLSSALSQDPSSILSSVIIHEPPSVISYEISDISSHVTSCIPPDVISNDDD